MYKRQVYGLVLFIALRRKNKDADMNGFGSSIIKMIISAVVMGIAVTAVKNILWGSAGSLIMKVIVIGISVVVGIIVYAVMTKITKLYEMTLVLKYAKNIIKKKGTEE